MYNGVAKGNPWRGVRRGARRGSWPGASLARSAEDSHRLLASNASPRSLVRWGASINTVMRTDGSAARTSAKRGRQSNQRPLK